VSDGDDAESTVGEQHDGDDEIELALFHMTQELRSEGVTPAELVPRLRELADRYEDHFEGGERWHEPLEISEEELPE